ncbi:MAG: tetratricopeptide repeat protein [Candidatus Rokuibacteriota bacterium]
MTAQIVAIVAVALPALALIVWPFVRRGPATSAAAGVPADARRLELTEEKASIYRALHELAFDHEAGHLSDEDHREVSQRYEARAAGVLRALDDLGPAPMPQVAPGQTPAPAPGLSRKPIALAFGGVVILVFGVVLGVSVGRFTEPDPGAASPPRSAGPMVATAPPPGPAPSAAGTGSAPGAASGKALAPEMLAGMLRAARQSLAEGRYQEAIAAYQAVLKREPRNVDAMTHLGLIVAIGGHADTALETWDKALGIDPEYAPAHLYRGEVLFEVKRDYPGAIQAWKRFVALVPEGKDTERVQGLIREAQTKQAR